MQAAPTVAVVGATGAVGRELVRLLEARAFPLGSLRLLASASSAGESVAFGGGTLTVEELVPGALDGVELAFFAAGGRVTREHAPAALASGCLVIDSSSAHRLDPEVPLVVPELNGDDLASHQGLVASPNCTTTVLLMALAPLHAAFGCTHVVGASYQAVSGAGADGMTELRAQEADVLAGRAPTPSVFPHPIAGNLLPHVDRFDADGHTGEETKLRDESRKILHHPSLRVSMTCVRVPVLRAHSVAASAAFGRPVTVEAAREVLAAAPGLELQDDPATQLYPTPLDRAGRDLCAVGRLRRDEVWDHGLAFWVSGDQLLKGAALNAVQIAEALHAREATT